MIIILGKNGYISEAFQKQLKAKGIEFRALSRQDVDYTNKEIFERYLSQNFHSKIIAHHNVTIINCVGFVGRPNVDACEKSKADCIELNIVFPSMLSSLCAQHGYRFIHISSGCIFTGYEKHFTEKDTPNFDFQNGSFYSGTKALAEKLVSSNNADSYIFRLRIPFDQYQSPRNYLTKILNYDRLLVAKNSFSHRQDFAKYCLELIEMDAPRGIYNLTNKGYLSTNEIIDIIKHYITYEKNFDFFSNLDEFMMQVTAPRSNCILSTEKAEKLIHIRNVKEAFEEAVQAYFT